MGMGDRRDWGFTCGRQDMSERGETKARWDTGQRKYRQEGKTYVVKDGDIIHFQFNVTAAKKK